MLQCAALPIPVFHARRATAGCTMHPDASTLWRGPRWALPLLLACLSTVGPFAIDTYLPAFTGIAQSLQTTPVHMQQTLSAYLVGFAVMNLFHGALADSFGRRPVILCGMLAFMVSSAGCAMAESIGTLVAWRTVQGIASGAGMVVSRAVIRDMFAPEQAQRVMSQVTIYFGIAPAIAPIIGGWLFVHAGWRSVFWLLTGIGALLALATWRLLPETLHGSQRQSFHPQHLLAGYWQLGADPRFLALALASGIPFNGMFLYVLAAPAFLGEHLQLGPTQFFYLFVLTIAGIMGGAWLSGRLAGRVAPRWQIKLGFAIMVGAEVLNLAGSLLLQPRPLTALPPIGLFAFGWALVVPAETLLVLDLVPERRGMASSLQAFIGALANGVVAGIVVPLVMHSTKTLALASALLTAIGVLSWLWVSGRVAAGGARAGAH